MKIDLTPVLACCLGLLCLSTAAALIYGAPVVLMLQGAVLLTIAMQRSTSVP